MSKHILHLLLKCLLLLQMFAACYFLPSGGVNLPSVCCSRCNPEQYNCYEDLDKDIFVSKHLQKTLFMIGN